ncbi:MAG: glutamate racemase [Treponemataceae bacterium]
MDKINLTTKNMVSTIQDSVDFAFIDSGTGGIPYMKFLKERHPYAQCVYIGDTQNFPYGTKTHEQIIDCVIKLSRLVIETFNPKVIVIACNTISVTALDHLRKTFNVPFIGTVPAIKLACKLSHKKRIALLATKRTIAESYTEKLIQQYASDCVVIKHADSTLIDFIEHNLFSATEDEKKAACKKSVDFLLSNDIDIIILGCTHFIHFSSIIQQLCTPSIQVIDSREGVISHAFRVVQEQEKLTSPQKEIEKSTLYVTAIRNTSDENEYKKLCNHLDIDFKGLISQT